MFRQILVHPSDVDFQRILWRPCDGSPIEHYLLIITYGLAFAPHLAMRVLKQLALDDGSDYPEAVTIFVTRPTSTTHSSEPTISLL